jgi:poly(3-hydroxybutyrate) depolymerase
VSFAAVLLGIAGAVSLALSVGSGGAVRPGHAEAGDSGGTRTVRAATSTGRQGEYYLPRGSESRISPLMVILHGTGGKGSLMLLRVQALAEREGFIALAPDSSSPSGSWTVGQRPDDVTEDYRHVMTTAREVLAIPGVRIDPERVLIAGFSVGGGVAASLASRESLFTALAALHGHVVPTALGPRRPRVWVSTGDRDRTRSVESMKVVSDLLRQVGFATVEFRVFRVDHALGDEEITALVAWWLARPLRGN